MVQKSCCLLLLSTNVFMVNRWRWTVVRQFVGWFLNSEKPINHPKSFLDGKWFLNVGSLKTKYLGMFFSKWLSNAVVFFGVSWGKSKGWQAPGELGAVVYFMFFFVILVPTKNLCIFCLLGMELLGESSTCFWYFHIFPMIKYVYVNTKKHAIKKKRCMCFCFELFAMFKRDWLVKGPFWFEKPWCIISTQRFCFNRYGIYRLSPQMARPCWENLI